MENTDDCACAIFWAAGLKELGNDIARIASAFDANLPKVQVLLSAFVYEEHAKDEAKEEGEEG